MAGLGTDAVVEGDDVQDVQELALVLVDALDVHVEEGRGVQAHAHLAQHVAGQELLVAPPHLLPALPEIGVVGMRGQGFEPVQVHDPPFADDGGDQFGQGRVGLQEPAARRDAVGHVDEAPRVELVEVPEQPVPEDVRVQLRHAVDLVAADDGQVGHAHLLAVPFGDEGQGAQQVRAAGAPAVHLVQEAAVDLENDLHVPR
ncbi:hypothetical protein DSECCO2_613850 [anaerobic digester metagenome]